MISIEKIEKPWGFELVWAKTDRYVGKILVINKGHRLSFQYHQKKEETIRVNKGLLEVEIEESSRRKKFQLKPGESFHVSAGLKHRFCALEDSEVIEVSSSELNDVIRLEDDYHRC